MRKNIVFSTTINQNVGDRIILRGIINALPAVKNHNLIYYDRGEFSDKDNTAHQNSFNREMILSITDFFINAGTPGFYQENYPFYDKCAMNNIPFSLVGIGCQLVDDGIDHIFNSERERFRYQLNSDSCLFISTRDSIIYNSILPILKDKNKLHDSICPSIFACTDPFFYSEKVIILNTCEISLVGNISSMLREVFPNIPIVIVAHDMRQILEHLDNVKYIDDIVYFSGIDDFLSFYDKYGYFVYTDRVHCALPQVFKSKIIFTQRHGDFRCNSLNIFPNIIQVESTKKVTTRTIEKAINSKIDIDLYTDYKIKYNQFNEFIIDKVNL